MTAKETARIFEFFEARGYGDKAAKELLKYLAYGDQEILKTEQEDE